LLVVLLVATSLVSCDPSTTSTPTGPARPADTETEPALAQATASATAPPTATERIEPTPTDDAPATATVAPTLTALPSPTSPSTATPPPASATTVAVPTPNATRSAELYDLGLEVYREQFCGTCHTLDAAGTGGIFGPPHGEMGALARERVLDSDYTGSATNAAEYIIESILEPKAYIVPDFAATSHHMPAYTHLDEEQILALVELLLRQE
jgi:mono/diheme cytochrome c family protein